MTELAVDDDGITVRGSGDLPVDVCFDGARVFSFWLRRDTEARGRDLFFAWPPALRRFLDGSVTVSLVDPATGEEWVRRDAVLGTADRRIRVVDANGEPMGLDKSLRLSHLFGERDATQTKPVLDAMETVLGALEAAGVQPFIAYGTLLGAIREQNFIGHDSDADLGYVSAHHDPVQVIAESFDLQRRLERMGYAIRRYSGVAFKISVVEADGATRGLDVFGGFMREDHLYLMGEVGCPFRWEWLYPRTTATLAGREFPVPAVPERLIEAMYGPHWRIPDPAFEFTVARTTTRRLNGWFRGMRGGIDRRWARQRAGKNPTAHWRGSSFVRSVREREPEIGTLVDLGCGFGADVLFLAKQGVHGVGLDFFPPELRRAEKRTANQGLEKLARFDYVNFNELRSVFATGTTLAREPGPRVVTARHVLDSVDAAATENLLRLAKMISRDSGRLHLQVQVVPTERSRRWELGSIDTDRLVAMIEATGGRVESQKLVSEREDDQIEDATASASPTILRMVVSWQRSA